MESQQGRQQLDRDKRQQQHDGLEIIDLNRADTFNHNADRNVNAAATRAQQRSSSFYGSTREGCQGPASKAPVNTISKYRANAQLSHAGYGTAPTQVLSAKPSSIASKTPSDAFALDIQLRKPRSTEQEQKQPGLDVALSHNGDAWRLQQHDLPNFGTANDEVVAAAASNKDGSQLHSQQPAGPNASDLSVTTQASIVRNQQQNTPYPKMPPDLAQMAQKLIQEKGWSHQKVWHWYYNGVPVEEAPGVANDPPVTPAPLEMLASEGIYEFSDWNHYHFRRRDEGIDPRQCKTVRFSGLDVAVMLLAGNDAEEGSKILLNHIVSAKEEFPNLKELSFAECVFGSPTDASHGIKELFRARFAYAYQLTCTSAFVWLLSFSATHRSPKEGREPFTPDFKVSITHFRAKKAFDEERAKLRLKRQEFGIERVKQHLCRDLVDDMGDIRHKFEDLGDFVRLMELRHVLACLSIQGTLERQIDDHRRNHEETRLLQTEPCEGWASAKGCCSRVSLACVTARRRIEIREVLLKMPADSHFLDIHTSKSSERVRRIFTEVMTFAESWFPRLFFTDDLRKKYGNPWTVTETSEDNKSAIVTEDTRSVKPGDEQSAIHAPQPSSDDGAALTAFSGGNGQEKDRSKKRRTSTEGQREKRRRADEELLTRLSRRRRQVGEKAIVPKQAESQQPLVSNSDLQSGQQTAYSSLLAEVQPTVPREIIPEAAHSYHPAETSSDSLQPDDQNSSDIYTTNTKFVAGTQLVVPNYNPQPYPSHQSSDPQMGWQQNANNAYNAADQLDNPHWPNNDLWTPGDYDEWDARLLQEAQSNNPQLLPECDPAMGY